MIKILKFYFLKSWGRARFSAGLTAQFQKEKKNFFPKNWAGWAGLLFHSRPVRWAVGPGPGRAGHISIPGVDYEHSSVTDLCSAHRKRTNNQLSDTSPDRTSHYDCKNTASFSFRLINRQLVIVIINMVLAIPNHKSAPFIVQSHVLYLDKLVL